MDPVLNAFLVKQQSEALALAASSDLLQLYPLDGSPARAYRAHFTCDGLVRLRDGTIEKASSFSVGIWFPDDYLRRAQMMEVLTWLDPPSVFHPNIASVGGGPSLICIGHFGPGTPLVDMLYQTFEVITYQRVTMTELNALNRDACVWARRHQHLLPIDRRPLKRPRSVCVPPTGVRDSNAQPTKDNGLQGNPSLEHRSQENTP
ncbi:MAG: hypothetical protein AB1486_00965 [Planctomycetota bacterium]